MYKTDFPKEWGVTLSSKGQTSPPISAEELEYPLPKNIFYSKTKSKNFQKIAPYPTYLTYINATEELRHLPQDDSHGKFDKRKGPQGAKYSTYVPSGGSTQVMLLTAPQPWEFCPSFDPVKIKQISRNEHFFFPFVSESIKSSL